MQASQAQPVKKRLSLLTRVLLSAVVLAALGYLVAGWLQPSFRMRAIGRSIEEALRNARSVTLVEFEEFWLPENPELIFQKVPATHEQIESLIRISRQWAPLPIEHTMCFEPHHRVEIVQENGSEVRLPICFHCHNFRWNGSENNLPESWRQSLVQFFTKAGMQPREDYSALLEKHPGYPRIKKLQEGQDAALK